VDSPLRKDLLSILRNNAIDYPLVSSKLKQITHMNEAFIDIRALLKLKRTCEQFSDGRLRISPLICESPLLLAYLVCLFPLVVTDAVLYLFLEVNGGAASGED